MCKREYGLRMSLCEGLWKADQHHQCFSAKLVTSMMQWEAQEVTQSDWDGTYLWVGHSKILVGKLVCDLSNLTQLIKGQQKTEPMTQTIVGSTKCKFPHPIDHFKFPLIEIVIIAISSLYLLYPSYRACREGQQKGYKHHQFKICFWIGPK